MLHNQEQQIQQEIPIERGQFYELLMQAPALIHILHGPEHIFEFFHPLGKELVGGRDLTGLKVREALPEYEGQGYFELLDQVYQTGNPHVAKEMRSLLKDEQGNLVERYFNFVYQPWRDMNNTIIGILNFAVDVTEQVKARKASEELAAQLRKERERLELAQQSGKIGTFEWYVQENKIFWTAELEALYGLPPNGFEGKYENWRDRVHPDDIETTEENLWNAVRGGPPYNTEFRVVWPDGSIRWVQGKGTVFFDETGQAVRVVGINTDITEEKYAQEALKQSERELAKRANEFRTLAENAPDVIGRHDKDFRYLYINPAIEKITGIPAQRFIGKTYREVGLLEVQCVYFDTQLAEVFRTGKTVNIEYSFTSPMQGKRYYHSHLIPEYDGQDSFSSVLVITRDITESKELEQRKDDFISMASHELKTPITMMKAQTQLLKRKLSRENATETVASLSKIEKQIDKLTRLITDLLDVSKIQAGQLDYTEEQVNMDALIQESVETVRYTTNTHAITISGSSHKHVLGDKDRLEQVFVNLISNAVKYSPQAKTVEVFIENEPGQIVVRVQDYGFGIPQVQQDKIFDRFYRVYDEKNKTIPGLGMGLYISAEIVARHNGRLWVESVEGQGSTFFVSLPVGVE